MAPAHAVPPANLAAIPSWEALFADPTLFDGLALQAQDALYEQVAVMEAAAPG